MVATAILFKKIWCTNFLIQNACETNGKNTIKQLKTHGPCFYPELSPSNSIKPELSITALATG